MKIFITGGCGQIGSHVTELLLDRGDEVMVIDNLETGNRANLPEAHENLTVVEDTISDNDLVDKLVGEFQPDVLIHCAASYKDPENWYGDSLDNAAGGAAVIKAAVKHKIDRFIYFQTALCYGLKPIEQPITLNHPMNPGNSSYSISKTTTEQYLELSGIDYVTFRLANVVGPRNISGPLPIFYKRLKEGKQCFVTTARRDFVFVKDLAKYVVKAVDGMGKGPYHFSSGTDVAIKELYDAVVEAVGLEDYPEPDIRPVGDDEAASILLDPSKTFADFGDIKFTPLKGIVASAVEFYNDYGVTGGYTHLKRHQED